MKNLKNIEDFGFAMLLWGAFAGGMMLIDFILPYVSKLI